MKSKKFVYGGIAVLAVAIIAGAMLLSGGTAVETAEVQAGSITRVVEDTGYVQPATDYTLYASQPARVSRIPVETGQNVVRGEVLLVLENQDLAAQITEARSRLAQARAAAEGARAGLERTSLEIKDAGENYARVKELYEAGAVTQVDYEKARLLLESLQQALEEQNSLLAGAQAQIDGLEQSLGQLSDRERQLVVTSPIDGTVLDLPVKLNQVLAPGTPLASIAAPDQLEVRADILSDDLAEVKLGQKVTLTAPVLGDHSLTGEVVKIYPRAEEKQSALGIIQRRVPVIIAISDPANLKPGYEVRVSIETRHKDDVTVVPREAVRTTKDGQRVVMVVVDNRVRHQVIETGLSDRENIEITGGLARGDLIVKDGSLDLPDKARVK